MNYYQYPLEMEGIIIGGCKYNGKPKEKIGARHSMVNCNTSLWTPSGKDRYSCVFGDWVLIDHFCFLHTGHHVQSKLSCHNHVVMDGHVKFAHHDLKIT